MTEATLFFGVLGALVAFVEDHKRCGDLEGGLDNSYVWLECSLWSADRPSGQGAGPGELTSL